MSKVTVTEEAIREMVREVLDNKDLGRVLVPEGTGKTDEPIKVNDVVDPSAAVTNPGNPDFRPHSRAELKVAVDALSADLPDEKVPDVYEKLVGALEVSQEKDDGDKMKKDTKTEAVIRAAVRQHLRDNLDLTEAFPKKQKEFGPVVGPLPPVTKVPTGVHGAEYMRKAEKYRKDLRSALKGPLEEPEADEVEAMADDDARKFKTVSDVGGASFQDIAAELGFSVAGAKQAVDKAMAKAQWLGQLEEESPEELEILVLSAINDYIKLLTKSGELTAADVQLMKDHPDIVRELDGFREFLDKSIRKARKTNQAIINPISDEGGEAPKVTASAAASAAPPATAPAAKAGKDTYKVYKGGPKYGGASVVTRYKGKVYGKSGASEFKPGETGRVSMDGDKLKVKKTGSDHTQIWDPVGESKVIKKVIKKGNVTIVLEAGARMVGTGDQVTCKFCGQPVEVMIAIPGGEKYLDDHGPCHGSKSRVAAAT